MFVPIFFAPKDLAETIVERSGPWQRFAETVVRSGFQNRHSEPSRQTFIVKFLFSRTVRRNERERFPLGNVLCKNIPGTSVVSCCAWEISKLVVQIDGPYRSIKT